MTETLYERAEVFISAKNLVDKDLFSKSDPFAVLFQYVLMSCLEPLLLYAVLD